MVQVFDNPVNRLWPLWAPQFGVNVKTTPQAEQVVEEKKQLTPIKDFDIMPPIYPAVPRMPIQNKTVDTKHSYVKNPIQSQTPQKNIEKTAWNGGEMISKARLKEIIDNRPEWVSPEEVFAWLQQRGYSFEWFEWWQEKKWWVFSPLKEAFSWMKEAVDRQYGRVKEAREDPSIKNLANVAAWAPQTAFNIAWESVGWVWWTVFNSLLKAGEVLTPDIVENFVKDGATQVWDKIKDKPIVKLGLEKLWESAEERDQFKSENPQAAQNIESVVNLTDLIGLWVVKKWATTAWKQVVKWAAKAKNAAWEALEWATDATARYFTNTATPEDKLFKAMNPSINKLNKNVDLKTKKANADTANRLIVEEWYRPTDTATRFNAHEKTMEKKRKEIEEAVNAKWEWFNRQFYMVDQNKVADVLDEFVKEVKKSWIEANKADIVKLEKEIAAMRKQWLIDIPSLEKKKQFINGVVDNWGNAEIWDVYKNGMKKATKKIWELEDEALSKIPWEFSAMKKEFWALKDTYEDVLKAHVKNQKKKGMDIMETYSRIEWASDLIWWALSVFTRWWDALKDVAKWAWKLFMWKSLQKAKDVDFLIEEWFKNLP